MRQKKMKNKLTLNKSTIATLDKQVLDNARGGLTSLPTFITGPCTFGPEGCGEGASWIAFCVPDPDSQTDN